MTLQTLDRVARTLNTDIGSLLPVGIGGGITSASVVDLSDRLTALANALRTRLAGDQRVLVEIDRVLEILKPMREPPTDPENST